MKIKAIILSFVILITLLSGCKNEPIESVSSAPESMSSTPQISSSESQVSSLPYKPAEHTPLEKIKRRNYGEENIYSLIFDIDIILPVCTFNNTGEITAEEFFTYFIAQYCDGRFYDTQKQEYTIPLDLFYETIEDDFADVNARDIDLSQLDYLEIDKENNTIKTEKPFGFGGARTECKTSTEIIDETTVKCTIEYIDWYVLEGILKVDKTEDGETRYRIASLKRTLFD